MKFLESKHYRPLQVFEEIEVADSYTFSTRDFLEEVCAENSPYLKLLNRLMPSIYLEEMVIQTENLNQFSQCTDFHTIAFDNKKEQFYTEEACYFSPDFGLFIITSDDLSNDYNEIMFNSGMSRVTRIYYDSTEPSAPENLKGFVKKYLNKYVAGDAKISILIRQDRDFTLKRQKITPYELNLDTMYNADFLPVHQRIKQELTNNHKGIALLHGISGSGKTNYIKWLTEQVPDKHFVFVPNNMIEMMSDPSFISFLIGHKDLIIVLEDCENYIAERSKGNTHADVVASILNIADGMLSDVLECQFICTFNAELTSIDHALLRRGRLIAEYHFSALSVSRCNAYLKSIGKDVEVTKPYSLAELVHMDEEEYRVEKNNDYEKSIL